MVSREARRKTTHLIFQNTHPLTKIYLMACGKKKDKPNENSTAKNHQNLNG
jgi:hypothetical protein